MTNEFERRTANGWGMLVALIMATLADGYLVFRVVNVLKDTPPGVMPVAGICELIGCVLALGLLITLYNGFFTLQPNEAAVLLLFGAYKGTVRSSGFHWANPFFRKGKISLRIRNFNTEKLKVNDLRGNPTDIAAVVVWRVQNTAHATFEVDDYKNYIHIQSEAALRHLASRYPYDATAEGDLDSF